VKEYGRAKLNLFGTGYGHVACSCEQGNELSGSIRGGDLLHNMKKL